MPTHDRSWMYKRALPDNSVNPDFIKGVASFIEFAKAHPRFMDGDKIKCPCNKLCKNAKFMPASVAKSHIIYHGFIKDYTNWHLHGEAYVSRSLRQESLYLNCNAGTCTSQRPIHHDNQPSTHVPSIQPSNVELDERDRFGDMLCDVFSSITGNDGGLETPNEDAQKFSDILRSLDVPLYEGSTVSKLAAAARPG